MGDVLLRAVGLVRESGGGFGWEWGQGKGGGGGVRYWLRTLVSIKERGAGTANGDGGRRWCGGREEGYLCTNYYPLVLEI